MVSVEENKMLNKIKIESGNKRKFVTGAEKQAASGKGTPVLVPGDAILEVAKHFEGGIPIYGARNWEKGIPLSEILNSLERHLQQEKMGLTDEPHARALVWNALVYLATKLRIEKGLLPFKLADMPVYEDDYNAAEIDGPRVFQPSDTVFIQVRHGNDKCDKYTRNAVNDNDGTGSYIRSVQSDDDFVMDHLILVGHVELYFYDDEVFPVEDS